MRHAKSGTASQRLPQHDISAITRNWRGEISRAGQDLSTRWQAEITESEGIGLPGHGREMHGYVVPWGGFRLHSSEWPSIGPAAHRFFGRLCHHRGGWVYLRGYRYYALDASMHLSSRMPTAQSRWLSLTERWNRYSLVAGPAISELTSRPARFAQWIAALSLLEWVANDLCALSWALLHSQDYGGNRHAIVDHQLATVLQMVADLGWHSWHRTNASKSNSTSVHGSQGLDSPGGLFSDLDRRGISARQPWFDKINSGTLNNPPGKVLASRLSAVLRDVEVIDLMEHVLTLLNEREGQLLRTVREGDDLWLAAATFESKVGAILRRHKTERVLILAEAFGALHVGYLWRALASPADRDRIDVQLVRSSVHEENAHRTEARAWRSGPVEASGRVVVHADDSLSSGRTHERMCAKLVGIPAAVYIAAMRFDTSTPRNSITEINWAGRTQHEQLQFVEALARATDGTLAYAPSPWTPHATSLGPAMTADEEEYHRIVAGHDRMLSALWVRFKKQILRSAIT